ncbi:peptide MFS transporter [Paeniglutamicibacter sulfureus]|uniref:POT family proton-dependent oligopeptide transporter n=1 Tax=Paeniglutamicibacter sulfureus TaxID=43666 RepID=A0ABU2BI82_9MICC|nr:oligopeptide:H+ symporter [Paeniglutamicibacter sulfureus]MDO2933918.1 oligopeptide:H+ symporter [Paeniglutamicibacter sulfureus]MDR7358359.1 POT family proton-dependent oligopeptide transporter [Paeniglutamicibacter sulfureus]
MSISTSLKDPSSTGFFGHPKTLSNLFSIEMWERFSFYGMQAILAYYMYFSVTDGGLGIPQDLALSLVGAYGGAVYLSTILGAWLADRLLGSEKVLLCSAFLIMGGHIALAALPGATGLAVGLVLVAVGSGGLKANATALVGSLYSKEDTRRDAGFSIFYMGVNIGGLLGPLLTGFLQQRWGFHFGFAAAAIGMAIGVAIYLSGRKNLPDSVKLVGNPLPANERTKYLIGFLAFVVVVVAAFALKIVTAESLARTIAYAVILASVIYFTLMLRSKRVSAVERKHVLAFIPLYIASAAFWALFQQQFTFIAVYSQERLDRSLFGWEMPASWVQSINPVFIIVLAGIFAALWTKMGTRQPGTVVKFSLALVLVGLAFLVFIPMNSLEKTPLPALVGILLLCTLAELLLSPIGQSVTTKLAPAAFGTQMIALFFLSVSLGTTLAGILAGFYTEGNEITYFLALGGTAIVLGVGLLLATPALKRLMGEVR